MEAIILWISYYCCMGIVINVLVSGLAVFATAYILPGVHVESFVTALIVAVVLGIVNAVLKPILVTLTLPITLFTLGLFTFVINALLVLLTARIVPGFTVDNFFVGAAFQYCAVCCQYIPSRV